MARPKTTDFNTLDVRPLLRMGAGAVRFPYGGPTLPFTRSGDLLRVGFEPMPYLVALVATSQPFGGARWWARCDGCAGRCTLLLLTRPGWRCRRCVGACYPVTREGARDRAFRRARSVRERLGMGPNLCVPLERPRGMHWHTFLRLAEREERETSAILAGSLRTLERIGKRLPARPAKERTR